MAARQPRPSDRDIRLHDPHVPHHAHSLPPPPHPHAHPPLHLNGSSIPSTPLAGGAAPPPPSAMMASPAAPAGANGVVPASIQKLAQANEQTWLLIGRVAEQMGNLEHALSAYENALRHNPMSLPGLTQVAGIARIKENYPKAVEYFQRVLNMQNENGEVWSALGHCYLMQDDLQKAYAAYQQALYLLPNPKEDPKLWYGIGILYDRYGSLDHAEEAFSSVLRMDKVALDFDKANEILFRLGIIYKQQGKYEESLNCFDRILRNPPNPLAHADIWFQIGHVYEQQHDHVRAKEAYERVVQDNPGHAKVLQQLGWLYHQDGSSFQNQETAIQYLTKSLEADPSDAQSWYLLGRAYMAGQKYNKAYEAYQQAVYRDGRNPTFWCSIGVLYFQINQYRDALDAYSRAIRINPYISEVWFDLGSLYESCNNQISDAIDAYARASELDPSNVAIAQRLQLLRNAQATGSSLPAAPGPQDVHPTAYANQVIPQPAGLSGPPLMLSTGGPPRPLFRSDSRGPPNELPLPVPLQHAGHASPPVGSRPFHGGPPPPVILDDSQRPPSHPALAPMDIDRAALREGPAPFARDGPRGGPPNSLLLHHPAPQPQSLQGHPHENFAPRPIRMSGSASPPPRQLPAFNDRPPVGPGQMPPHPRSPTAYSRELAHERGAPGGWDRRGPPPPGPDREWDRETRGRPPPPDYAGRPTQATMYAASRPHTPSPIYSHAQHRSISRDTRDRSPDVSPRSAHPGYQQQRGYWDSKQSGPGMAGPPPPGSSSAGPQGPGPRGHSPASRSSMSEALEPSRRYDPRFDGRESQPREYERDMMMDGRYAGSPEQMRHRGQPPPPPSYSSRTSESPHITPASATMEKSRGIPRRTTSNASTTVSKIPNDNDSNGSAAEKEKRKRRNPPRRGKEDTPTPSLPHPSSRHDSYAMPSVMQPSTSYRSSKAASQGSPEPSSSNGSGSANRSAQPSPTGSAPHPAHQIPRREVDEDYDEGVAEVLVNMAYTHGGPSDPRNFGMPPSGPMRSPPDAQRMPQHMMSKHSGMGRSPPSTTSTKRPLSPGPEENDAKRSRVGSISRRMSSPSVAASAIAASSSTRPSPIPFRQQPTSHSPELRQGTEAGSPALPTMLPPHPHPRPIGHHGGLTSGPGMPLAPLSTRSPPGMASPTGSDRMRESRSNSPRPSAKREIVVQPVVRSPPASAGSAMSKGTPSPASSQSSHASRKMVLG